MLWNTSIIKVLILVSCWLKLFVDAFSARRPGVQVSKAKESFPRRDHGGNDAGPVAESNISGTIQMIPRISKQDFDPFRDYYQYLSGDGCGRPIVVEGALSLLQCQDCCDRLMAEANSLHVDLQQQTQKTDTRLLDCNLDQAIEIIMRKSNSQTAFTAFSEGLLEQNDGALQDVQQCATRAKEELFGDNDQDWFDFFPYSAQPTDAVIVAGAGATSTLHRDPMEWTGTSLCLEGTKVWRFLEPPPRTADIAPKDHTEEQEPRVAVLDRALQSYRLQSIAWQSDDDPSSFKSLSAGWQSDLSLYHNRNHGAIPSAQTLAEMDEKCRYVLLQDLVTNLDILQPNVPNSALGEDSGTTRIHTVIQQPGDLLLIPAHWWHQTYGIEPSVAIASQRCGKGDAELVFQHIWNQRHRSQSGVGTTSNNAIDCRTSLLVRNSSSSPQEAVAKLFQSLH